MNKIVAIAILAALAWSAPLYSPCFAENNAPTVQLTENEQAFLRAHPVIVLGTEKDWEPFVIVKGDGSIQGYDADMLARINRLTGANFQLKAGSWRQMVELARDRDVDGLSTGAIHEERKAYLNFSNIYFSIRKTVLTQMGNPRGIHSLHDLEGKTLAIHEGNRVDEKLAEQVPGAAIYHTGSLKEAIEAVISGQADAMFGNGASMYYARKYNLPYLQIAFPLEETLRLAFGVRKDWPEAIGVLNKGLAAIPERDKLEMVNKWFLVSSSEFEALNNLPLTQQEQSYLSSRNAIRMCTDPNWAPYVSINAKGELEGIFAELNQMISKKIGKEVSLVPTATWDEAERFARERKCDILLAVADSPERQSYLNFTSTLLSIPKVIATKTDKLFVENFDRLAGETISLVRGYSTVQFFAKHYPQIRIALVDTPQQGLQLVHEGKAFGYVDSLLNIARIIQQQGYFDLKIAGKLDDNYELGIGIRNDDPLLLSIYEKAVNAIPQEERQKLLDQAVVVRYDKGFDYTLFWWMLAGIILITLIGALLFYLSLSRRHKRDLELQVAQRTLELEKKNFELERFTYTVSHDLKSPLVTISGFVALLEQDLGEQQSAEVRSSLAYIRSATDKMYTLLNDLLELSRVGHTVNPVSRVSLREVTAEAMELLHGQIEQCQADIRIGEALPIVTGDFLRLRDVMQNLLSNALNYCQKGTKPVIEIGVADSKHGRAIYVRDNGRGIPAEYQEKVFGLFERLHTDCEGTGIGLALVRRIIELHGGKVWIESSGEGLGTTFWFTLAYAD